MKIVSVRLLCLTLLALTMIAAENRPIPLWPGRAPGEQGDIGPERETTTAKDRAVAGRPVSRIGFVSEPTLTVFPAKSAAPSPAVLVFPGGGYNILAYDLEGSEVCQWLNSLGITGVLVKYRVPARKWAPTRHGPQLQDAQRAVSTVRHRASEWRIDPNRIGVLGFSAGGHLAAVTSNAFATRTYAPLDAIDTVSPRPDFAVLIYAAYLAKRDALAELAPEMTVTERTPPTLIIQTQDDTVPVENALTYYLALKRAKVPVEMHLYSKGGHGYGLRPSPDPVSVWPKRAEEWFRSLGLIKR